MDLKSLPPNIKVETTQGDLKAFAISIADEIVKKVLAQMESGDEILWIDEACKLLNLAKPTVYGLISKRKIPSYKKGRKVYFLRSELEAWLMAGRRKTHDELAQDAEKHLAEKSRKNSSSTKK